VGATTVVTLADLPAGMLAAQDRKPVPDELRVAVQALVVDDDTFDADERRAVVEDLATLANQTPSHT
jgi:hypothetical protein